MPRGAASTIRTPLTAAQCRAARAFLDISQEELAITIGVLRRVVLDFEAERRRPSSKTLRKMSEAFEARGIGFLETDALVGVVLYNESGVSALSGE